MKGIRRELQNHGTALSTIRSSEYDVLSSDAALYDSGNTIRIDIFILYFCAHFDTQNVSTINIVTIQQNNQSSHENAPLLAHYACMCNDVQHADLAM